MATAYRSQMPCSSASQFDRSSRRRKEGPGSMCRNLWVSERPVTNGMRAMRLLCVSGEWVSDIGTSGVDGAFPRACLTRRPLARPKLQPSRNVLFVEPLAKPFEDHRHALAAADAHGLEAGGLVVGLEAVWC